MYDLVQTIQVLTPEEVDFVNEELDKSDEVLEVMVNDEQYNSYKNLPFLSSCQ